MMDERRIRRSLDRARKKLATLAAKQANLSVYGHWEVGYLRGRISTLEDWLDEIAEKPTADTVEVVRCKNCANKKTLVHSTDYGTYVVCNVIKGHRHGLNDYCSHGEREDDND